MMSDKIIQPTLEAVAPKPEDRHELPQKIPHRNFWLAMGVQLLLLATIPARSIYAIATGTTVYLETAPVDPYDLLRGYYQTLSYQISNREQLSKLPGGEILNEKSKNNANSREVFVTLQLPRTGKSAAKPIAISPQQPTNLPADRLAVRGVFDRQQIRYDLEKFYLPETQASQVNQAVSASDRRHLLVEVKVDGSGHPALVGLWVGDKKYEF